MCHLCRSKAAVNALPTTGAFTDTERFHATPKEYKPLSGIITEATLSMVSDYVHDVLRIGHTALSSQYAALDLAEFMEWMSTSPASAFLRNFETGLLDLNMVHWYREFCTFKGLQYLQRSNFRRYPSTYVPYAEGAAGRMSNYQDTAKEYIRWHNDRILIPGVRDTLADWSSELGATWIVTGKSPYVGTFPKRLSKFILKNTGIKLCPQHLEQIGNLCSTGMDSDAPVSLTFDREFIERGPAEYCHQDSCWWGGYSFSRAVLFMGGGYAVRSWDLSGDVQKPIARCWLLPYQGKYVLMNAYGSCDLYKFARLLSNAWGLSYKKISVRCSASDRQQLYINSGEGILLGGVGEIEKMGSLEMNIPFRGNLDNLPKCKYCGTNLVDRLTTQELRGQRECAACHAQRNVDLSVEYAVAASATSYTATFPTLEAV